MLVAAVWLGAESILTHTHIHTYVYTYIHIYIHTYIHGSCMARLAESRHTRPH
jgi:hypothetical protein